MFSGRSQYARYQNLAGDFKPHMVSQSVVEMSTNQYIEVWCVCTSGASMVANSAFTNYNPTGMTSVPTCIVNISAVD